QSVLLPRHPLVPSCSTRTSGAKGAFEARTRRLPGLAEKIEDRLWNSGEFRITKKASGNPPALNLDCQTSTNRLNGLDDCSRPSAQRLAFGSPLAGKHWA